MSFGFGCCMCYVNLIKKNCSTGDRRSCIFLDFVYVVVNEQKCFIYVFRKKKYGKIINGSKQILNIVY